jgi:23S rRNA (cytidine1920-2'-O)/16S rRNA (cytidine1409-2'-O)-methyltransferase
MTRQRLDELLVLRGHYASRARARDAILRGTVEVDGLIARKPGAPTPKEARIVLADPARTYVSRAALKLAHALDHFGLDPTGLECLDLGASTGGFTQLLLERGARHVTAVDVGHGQLVDRLRDDPRVTLHEGLNARDLRASHLRAPAALIVADLSFISLRLALPPALTLAPPGARLVALVKPQFESGPDALDGRGLVADPARRDAAVHGIAEWLTHMEWRVLGMTASPLAGGDGNREFLIAAEKPC